MDHTKFDQRTQYYIQLHDLVEVIHKGSWWIAIISSLKNQETGKYMVSLPFSRKVIEIEPAQIRPCKIPPQTQENEMYRIGDMVEACQERRAYGLSWFPATVEKIIRGHYFLIKYDNVEKIPNGHLTEILVSNFLRPSIHLFPRPDHEIGMFSQVEVFYEGGWSPGMATRVSCEGDHFDVQFKENDTKVTLKVLKGAHLRLRWEWSGTDWTECATLSGLKSLKINGGKIKVYRRRMMKRSTRGDSSIMQPEQGLRNTNSNLVDVPVSYVPHMYLADGPSHSTVLPNIGAQTGCMLNTPTRDFLCNADHIPKSNHSPNHSPKCTLNSVGSNIILPFEKVLSEWKDLEDSTVVPNIGAQTGCMLNTRDFLCNADNIPNSNHSGLKSLKRKESSSDEVARTELEGEMHQTSESSVQPTNMRRDNGSDDDNCDSRNLTRYSDEFQTKEINGGNIKVYRRRMMKRSTRGDSCIIQPEQGLRNTNSSLVDVPVSYVPHMYLADGPSHSTVVPNIGAQTGRMLNTPARDFLRNADHIPKSNHSPKDSPKCVSNSVGSNIVLPFEKVLSQWKDLEDCNILKSTPQKPHFMRLRSVWSGYAEDVIECVAYGLVLNFVQQVNKIEKLSVHDDVTSFEAKLAFFEEDGFVVDPIRAHLNELVKTKSAVEGKLLKRMEWGRELGEVEEDNKNVVESLNYTEKELNQLRYKMEKLQRKRKGLFDRSTNNREIISSLENKISEEDEFLDNLDRYLPRPKWNNQ